MGQKRVSRGVPKSVPPESVLAVAESVLVLLEYSVDPYKMSFKPADQRPNPTPSAIFKTNFNS